MSRNRWLSLMFAVMLEGNLILATLSDGPALLAYFCFAALSFGAFLYHLFAALRDEQRKEDA